LDRRRPPTFWQRVKAHIDTHFASFLILVAVFAFFRSQASREVETARNATDALAFSRLANVRSEETQRRLDTVVSDMGGLKKDIASVYWLMERMYELQTGRAAPSPPDGQKP
jgi:hypothetical protein